MCSDHAAFANSPGHALIDNSSTSLEKDDAVCRNERGKKCTYCSVNDLDWAAVGNFARMHHPRVKTPPPPDKTLSLLRLIVHLKMRKRLLCRCASLRIIRILTTSRTHFYFCPEKRKEREREKKANTVTFRSRSVLVTCHAEQTESWGLSSPRENPWIKSKWNSKHVER